MSISRRWWFRVAMGLLVTLALGLGQVFWQRHQAREELAAAVAELDASDPHWRLEAIEEKRRTIPADENGALVVNAAVRLLPKNWESKTDADLEETPPQVSLRPETVQQLRDELATHAAAPRCVRRSATPLRDDRLPGSETP